MKELVIVGTGSFIGGIFRYCVSSWLLDHLASSRFPLGTFIVNLLGCFLIGSLSAVSEHQHWLTQNMRLLLMTGLLGGFTTFSAFGLETIALMKAQSFELAFLNVFGSVFVCLGAVWLGMRIFE